MAVLLADDFDVALLSSEEVIAPGTLTSTLPTDRPCVLAGWSIGGMLALEAATGVADGSMLCLIGSTARFVAGDDTPHGVPMAEVRSMSISFRRKPEETLANFDVQAALPHDLIARAEPFDGDQDDCRKLADGLKYLRDADLRETASRVRVPTLILHGQEDRVISVDAADDLSRRLETSHVRRMEAVGHDLPVRCPEWIVSNLIDYWKNDVARTDAG
ncbi:biotin biosynthesis protein (BioH) [Rhodopirellula sallentina SM41]|uniref:Biotin biosynthesis protein (BioH) n=2 Tax=Rhodopirellula TaxID=265488 RepID=M5U0Z7_9BACT|nr:biotin biosynthesis protein (BioH) [Rhodopirellula sallentina SM41]